MPTRPAESTVVVVHPPLKLAYLRSKLVLSEYDIAGLPDVSKAREAHQPTSPVESTVSICQVPIAITEEFIRQRDKNDTIIRLAANEVNLTAVLHLKRYVLIIFPLLCVVSTPILLDYRFRGVTLAYEYTIVKDFSEVFVIAR
jgi:hypothetical protein